MMRVSLYLLLCLTWTFGQTEDAYFWAETLVTGEEILSPGYFSVREGRIIEIKSGAVPEGKKAEKSKVIWPGLVDAHCFLGMEGALEETSLAMTPEFSAEDGYNPYEESLKANVLAGLTAWVLAPGDRNLISGKMAIVFGGETQLNTYLLRSQLGTKISLSPRAFFPYRRPTTLMGGAYEIRQGLKTKALPQPWLFLCENKEGIALAVEQIQTHQAKGILYLRQRALFKTLPTYLKSLKYEGAILLETPSLQSSTVVLRLPSQLVQKGFLVAFTSHRRKNAAEALWMGVNLAIRAGLKKEDAMAMITRNPAKIFGVDTEIGRLNIGTWANFIMANDNPLNLSTRIQSVFVKGKKIVLEEQKF